MFLRSLRNWIALGCITLLLTACGGGSGGGNSASPGASGTSSGTGTSSGGTSSSGSNSGTTAPTPTALTYAVQLSWTAPTTRADGTPLTSTELTGYRIYYSLEGSDASQDTVVPISGGNTTSLQVTLSAAGTYAFAITALDQNGLESALSTPVLVAVN
jgi:type II secretory pathway component GspD/PulD (secretin)